MDFHNIKLVVASSIRIEQSSSLCWKVAKPFDVKGSCFLNIIQLFPPSVVAVTVDRTCVGKFCWGSVEALRLQMLKGRMVRLCPIYRATPEMSSFVCSTLFRVWTDWKYLLVKHAEFVVKGSQALIFWAQHFSCQADCRANGGMKMPFMIKFDPGSGHFTALSSLHGTRHSSTYKIFYNLDDGSSQPQQPALSSYVEMRLCSMFTRNHLWKNRCCSPFDDSSISLTHFFRHRNFNRPVFRKVSSGWRVLRICFFLCAATQISHFPGQHRAVSHGPVFACLEQ